MFSHPVHERNELLLQVVAVERDLPCANARAPADKIIAPAHICGVGVCVATWAWFHGISGAAYKKVRASLTDPDVLIDGRTLHRGPRGAHKVDIIAWFNLHALEWGDRMAPCSANGYADVIKLNKLNPATDL